MAIQNLQRNFKLKDQILPDPNPNFTEDEVRQFYADEYPELTNASIKAPEYQEDKVIYEFESNLGSKG